MLLVHSMNSPLETVTPAMEMPNVRSACLSRTMALVLDRKICPTL